MNGTEHGTHPDMDLEQKGRMMEDIFEQKSPEQDGDKTPGRILEQNQAKETLKLQWRQFTTLFDNFADSLYVIDPRTYEILLVNKALENAVGKNPAGGLCYKELQGLDTPCDFCTNETTLREKSPYTWEYSNPLTGRTYHMTDQIINWPDGRDVKFSVAVDVTKRKEIEDALRKSEERLRLLSRRLAEAQETERKRLARELHDSIGGKLTGIKFGVEKAMRQQASADDTPGGMSLKDVASMIRDAIEATRRVCNELRPVGLDDLGLFTAIKGESRRFQTIYSDIQTTLAFELPEDDIPEVLSIAIFRIVQEALNNIGKHSNARLARIGLAKKWNCLELKISDDGQGFVPEQIDHLGEQDHGMGLRGIQERTELSGGQCTLWSEPGRGTVIRALWRLNSR